MPSNCGAGEDPESPLDDKEIKLVNLKGDQPWIFTGRTDAKSPVFWSPDTNRWLIEKVPAAGKDWGEKEKRAPEDEMTGQRHQCNEHELGQTLGDGEGQGGLACCSPWGCRELDMTGWLNNKSPLPFGPPSHPHLHPIHLGHHREPSWAPCAIQQLPTGYQFYTWQWIYVNPSLPVHLTPATLSPCVCSLHLQIHSYSCPEDRFICTFLKEVISCAKTQGQKQYKFNLRP